MSGLGLKLNISDLEQAVAYLKAKYPAGIGRALRRAAKAASTSMARSVAKDLGIAIRSVGSEIQVREAPTGDAIFVSVTGLRLPLIAFKARGPEPSRGKGKGVSYKLGTEGRSRVPNAFITRVGVGGHRGVFVRVGDSKRKSVGAWGKNLPIKELFGPSLPHVANKHMPEIREAGMASLVKNLQHEAEYALRRQ